MFAVALYAGAEKKRKSKRESLHMLCTNAWILFSIYPKRSAHRMRHKSFSLSKQLPAFIGRGFRRDTRGEMDDEGKRAGEDALVKSGKLIYFDFLQSH